MKQIKGWAGSWGDINGKGPVIVLQVFAGENAEARCAQNYQDPVPVILKLDRKKQRKAKGRER